MNIQQLTEWLKSHKIKLVDRAIDPENGFEAHTFEAVLPAIPFAANRHAQFTLTVSDPNEIVDRRVLDAMLRHFYMAQLEPPVN